MMRSLASSAAAPVTNAPVASTPVASAENTARLSWIVSSATMKFWIVSRFAADGAVSKTNTSRPSPPISVSLPRPPASVLLPALPMIRLALALPAPLMLATPERYRFSRLGPKTNLTLDMTVSVPASMSS